MKPGNTFDQMMHFFSDIVVSSVTFSSLRMNVSSADDVTKISMDLILFLGTAVKFSCYFATCSFNSFLFVNIPPHKVQEYPSRRVRRVGLTNSHVYRTVFVLTTQVENAYRD